MWRTAHSFGVDEELLIVGPYDFVDTTANSVNNNVRLWINPTPGDFAAEAIYRGLYRMSQKNPGAR